MKNKQPVLILICSLLLLALSGAFAYSKYTQLPKVGLDPKGDCLWIMLAGDIEKRECPLYLPEVYLRVKAG